MARSFTREELIGETRVLDDTAQLVKNGFNGARAADVVFLPEPYYIFHSLRTTHGTPYNYDTNIPLIFMGSGVRAGNYFRPVRSNDIAPTLSELIGAPKPKSSVGTVLSEMFIQ